MCQQDHISLWSTFVVSIWPVDSLPQLNLSTAQKFRHSSWRASWQLCWILTQDLITFRQSFCDNCIWHSLVSDKTRQVYFVRNGADSPRCPMWCPMWWLPYREPCVSYFDWTREARGQAKSLGAHRQDSWATACRTDKTRSCHEISPL